MLFTLRSGRHFLLLLFLLRGFLYPGDLVKRSLHLVDLLPKHSRVLHRHHNAISMHSGVEAFVLGFPKISLFQRPAQMAAGAAQIAFQFCYLRNTHQARRKEAHTAADQQPQV